MLRTRVRGGAERQNTKVHRIARARFLGRSDLLHPEKSPFAQAQRPACDRVPGKKSHMANADVPAVPVASTTNTASCLTCRSKRRHGSPDRGRDSLRAWTMLVRCARTSSGRRRRFREFQPLRRESRATSGQNFPWPRSTFLVCMVLLFGAANADFTCFAGHSRRRRQKSTPRSTARRAQGTLLPSTRFTMPPNSISRFGPEIAFCAISGTSEVIERAGG